MWYRAIIAYLLLISSLVCIGTYVYFLILLHTWMLVIAQVCIVAVLGFLGIAACGCMILLLKLILKRDVHSIGEQGSIVSGLFSIREVRPLLAKAKQSQTVERRQPTMLTELHGLLPPPGEFSEQEMLYRGVNPSVNGKPLVNDPVNSSESELSDEMESLLEDIRETPSVKSVNLNTVLIRAKKAGIKKAQLSVALGMNGRYYEDYCRRWKELGLD